MTRKIVYLFGVIKDEHCLLPLVGD